MSKDRYKELLALIPDGKDNAISQSELATLLRCHKREVRAFIQDARIDGVAICSTQDGYFMSDDPEEVSECYRFFEQRHKANGKVLTVIGKHLQTLKGKGEQDV